MDGTEAPVLAPAIRPERRHGCECSRWRIQNSRARTGTRLCPQVADL